MAFLLAISLLSRASAQEKKPGRDWQKYPAIVEVDTPEDIYAFGDVHGDYERIISLLVAAKIIPDDPGPPEKAKWNAGKAVVVCTGDFIDKWDQSLRVISLLRTLQTEAGKAGGRLVVTLGNHEAEFLADPRNKKAKEFIAELQAKSIKPEAVGAGTDAAGIGQWMRALPAGARVNDWFFAHAGNTHNRTLSKLKEDLQNGIDKFGYKALVLQDLDSLLLARMAPQPWWEAEGDSGAQSREKLAKCVHALGVKHLVIGHAPGKIVFADKTVRNQGDLVSHFNGLIFMIDTGMSRAVAYSPGAVLHIQSGFGAVKAYRIRASGNIEQIWSE
jgi:hypothetical protein